MTTTIFLLFSTVSRLGTARGTWQRRRGPVQGHPGPVEREVSGDRPAEVVVGYVVVGRDSERVREERPAVSPHPGLARRRDQGVGGPRAERGPSEVVHRAGAALGPESDRAGTGGEREERRLLPCERREISSLAEATEWPGVEEKKHQGKRHHHRLRHEAEREAEKGHEIAPQCGLDGVALVGQEREHPAQAASTSFRSATQATDST